LYYYDLVEVLLSFVGIVHERLFDEPVYHKSVFIDTSLGQSVAGQGVCVCMAMSRSMSFRQTGLYGLVA
jgi:riboflavin synthase alpha subunit